MCTFLVLFCCVCIFFCLFVLFSFFGYSAPHITRLLYLHFHTHFVLVLLFCCAQVETAKNIGRSCNLLTDQMKGERNLIEIDVDEKLEYDEAKKQTLARMDFAWSVVKVTTMCEVSCPKISVSLSIPFNTCMHHHHV